MPRVSANGLTVTVPLREGVRFHDGPPFSADDVGFTYRSILDPKVATRVRDLLFETLADVTAPDPQTVRLTLKRPDPAFADKLYIGIVPKHLLQGQDLNTTAFNSAPVDTGPFVFGQWRKGERLEFTANPNYFGGKVASPRLVFAFIPDENARVAALRDGSVDADASGIAPQNAQRLRTDGSGSSRSPVTRR
ncbi:MAG: hypothetical protein H0V92_05190 [Pseudonocardiales bacterium]|nr:hypothetical protein [Pseudonocardiales bacterium]